MGNQFNFAAAIACLKTCVFAFNIIYWIFGLVLLGVGLWAEFDLHRYMELSPDFSGTATHGIIGIACLIIVVSSFAFSCIIKGHVVMLYVYAAFLYCIFILNTGVGLVLSYYWDTFEKSLHDGLTQTIMSNDPNKANFDFAQKHFQCCGVSNYTDWKRLSPQKVIPISCCIDPNNCVTANYSDVFQRGCYEMIVEYVQQNLGVVIGLAIFTALLPTAGGILTSYLVRFIKQAKFEVVD